MRIGAMIVFGWVVLVGCSTMPSDQTDQSPVDERANVEYGLGSGDELRVSVFGEPELSGEFIVAGSGQLSLPLLGQTDVTGLSVSQFERRVETLLRDGDILRDPQVSAEVINYRPFYIYGEVGSPGEYAYRDGMTVMNAVATAGGFTYRANQKKVYIVHNEAGEAVRYRLTANTRVLPGDTIEVVQCIFC